MAKQVKLPLPGKVGKQDRGLRASLASQTVKNQSGTQEIQVQSLGQEDLLEKGMATHSSILAWRISGTEEPGGLYSL